MTDGLWPVCAKGSVGGRLAVLSQELSVRSVEFRVESQECGVVRIDGQRIMAYGLPHLSMESQAFHGTAIGHRILLFIIP